MSPIREFAGVYVAQQDTLLDNLGEKEQSLHHGEQDPRVKFIMFLSDSVMA